MTIDEDKKLTRFCKDKVVESDHIPVILKLNMKPPNKSANRMEIFNFKNVECLAAFKEETSKTSKLSDCFSKSKNKSIKDQVKKWRKCFDTSVNKCFRKIRLGGKKERD